MIEIPYILAEGAGEVFSMILCVGMVFIFIFAVGSLKGKGGGGGGSWYGGGCSSGGSDGGGSSCGGGCGGCGGG